MSNLVVRNTHVDINFLCMNVIEDHLPFSCFSENSSVAVEVFNREGLLPVVLHFLQPDAYPSSLVVAAGNQMDIVVGKYYSKRL